MATFDDIAKRAVVSMSRVSQALNVTRRALPKIAVAARAAIDKFGCTSSGVALSLARSYGAIVR